MGLAARFVVDGPGNDLWIWLVLADPIGRRIPVLSVSDVVGKEITGKRH